MRAIVVADGDVPDRAALDAAWPGWSSGTRIVIAADGGAIGAGELGLGVDLIVGDMDSLGQDRLAGLRERGIEIEVAPSAKDESDTELAVIAAVRRGARSMVIVGGFGGVRFDHALANVGLLALPELAGLDVELIDERTRVTLLRAPDPGGRPVRRLLPGRVGDIVSLLPIGTAVEGVTTEGLRYPLRDEDLVLGPARGLSNVRLAPDAAVTVRRGLLLVVESPATLSA